MKTNIFSNQFNFRKSKKCPECRALLDADLGHQVFLHYAIDDEVNDLQEEYDELRETLEGMAEENKQLKRDFMISKFVTMALEDIIEMQTKEIKRAKVIRRAATRKGGYGYVNRYAKAMTKMN